MRVRSSIVALGFLVSLVAVALPASAQQAARPKTYGIKDQIVLTLGPCDAKDRSPLTPFQVFACGSLRAGQNNVFNSAVPSFPLHLPEGVLIDQVDIHYYDTITGSQPFVSLTGVGHGTTDQVISDNLPPWDTGEHTASFIISPPYQVHNDGFVYVLNMDLDTVDATHYEELYSITIRYRLQVSPAPEVATFNDVPTTHPFFQFVEALAKSGITAGCGNNNFCPDKPLTRGQMAVFLAKALGLHFSSTQLPN